MKHGRMKQSWHYLRLENRIVDESGFTVCRVPDKSAGCKLAAAPDLIEALNATLTLLETTNKAADLRGSRATLTLIHKALLKAKGGAACYSPELFRTEFCEECRSTWDAAFFDSCPKCFEKEMDRQRLESENLDTQEAA